MADLIANAPSSLSDDEIEALLAMLEKVSPSPSIEIDFFDEIERILNTLSCLGFVMTF